MRSIKIVYRVNRAESSMYPKFHVGFGVWGRCLDHGEAHLGGRWTCDSGFVAGQIAEPLNFKMAYSVNRA